MKMLLKYISFFALLINASGEIHANTKALESDFSVCESFEINQNGFDYFDDSDALIHEDSNSNPKKKFSETEEIEIEEAQNDSDSDVDSSNKFLQSGDTLTALFYSYLSTYHNFHKGDKISTYLRVDHDNSYHNICVRFCVFRL